MPSSDYWDSETAARYDDTSAFMFEPDVLDPAVDFLASLAGEGPTLEFAIGTGRVAIPLTDRGVPVSGIELSQPMVDELHKKRAEISVVVGDMATSRAPGQFSLVYLVWNSLGNLRTQSEQVACFSNAARHLAPGGYFVIELWIPGIRRFPPGQEAVPFHVGDRHVGIDGSVTPSPMTARATYPSGASQPDAGNPLADRSGPDPPCHACHRGRGGASPRRGSTVKQGSGQGASPLEARDTETGVR